jgi:TatD DNase family protein
MVLTDTHAHLYSEAFDADRDAVMREAIKQGVERFFIPAIDSSYTQAMLDLEAAYPHNIFLMTGLHPTHVKADFKEELAHIEHMLAERKFYAIGEIGIDLYWDKTYFKEQQHAFRYQIGLAKNHGLPIVIHCREAFDEIFTILESEKGAGLYGIFHCFTGTLEHAKRAIGLGMKLGIGGVVTYKKGKIDTFIREIDLSHIVLETDSPYLAPVPYRGKRNQSAYLIEIVKRLSEIYGRSVEEIATLTTTNSKEVFGV